MATSAFNERFGDGREFGGGTRGAGGPHRDTAELAREEPHYFIGVTAPRFDQRTKARTLRIIAAILLLPAREFPLTEQLILAA